MAEDRELVEAIKRDTVQVLYEDRKYFIGVSRRGENSHNVLYEGRINTFLDRGILRELAVADEDRLRSALSQIGGDPLLYELQDQDIHLQTLRRALARARLEEERLYQIFLLSMKEN